MARGNTVATVAGSGTGIGTPLGVHRMRAAILGAGAMGGYYGARLAKAGEDIVFVARGAHLQALKSHGLRVKTADTESIVRVTAVGQTDAVGPVELVLFCVKSYDTAAAAASLGPLVTPQTLVLTLQNGIDNAETIASAVGREAVLVGSVYVALHLVAPGVIVHAGGEGTIVFGELAGGATARTRRVAEIVQRAGIPHEVSTDMPRILWEKFLFIAGVGGITALARSGIGPLLASAEGQRLLTASCAEVDAIARAEGVHLGADAVQRTLTQAARLAPQWQSSMARDLEVGRRLEVEALSGAVVRRGRTYDIPTPVHQAIWACLAVHQPSQPDEQRSIDP
jgi:2-dehydropantoate 2-reductase